MEIITFLSDFGIQDGYVGSVKGILLDLAPQSKIIDISHEIRPFHIEEAAYVLMSYYNYFPKETVHLAVIDPGVGSERRPLIIRTANYFFVGPDNGLFSHVLRSEAFTAYEISEQEIIKLNHGRKISRTFHGRDLFAPAAASLAAGYPVHALGKKLTEPPQVFSDHISEDQECVNAKIISIDRFGNLITNFSKFEFDQLKNRRIKQIKIGEKELSGLQTTYSEVKPGELLALWGSADFLEISVNQGNAARELQTGIGKHAVTVLFEKIR